MLTETPVRSRVPCTAASDQAPLTLCSLVVGGPTPASPPSFFQPCLIPSCWADSKGGVQAQLPLCGCVGSPLCSALALAELDEEQGARRFRGALQALTQPRAWRLSHLHRVTFATVLSEHSPRPASPLPVPPSRASGMQSLSSWSSLAPPPCPLQSRLWKSTQTNLLTRNFQAPWQSREESGWGSQAQPGRLCRARLGRDPRGTWGVVAWPQPQPLAQSYQGQAKPLVLGGQGPLRSGSEASSALLPPSPLAQERSEHV